MSEIPEDVKKAAGELAERIRDEAYESGRDGWFSTMTAALFIEEAILAERAAERERCANHLMLTVNAPAEALRLEYGELTAQEVRTIRAVLTQQASSIRSSHE